MPASLLLEFGFLEFFYFLTAVTRVQAAVAEENTKGAASECKNKDFLCLILARKI